MLVIMTGGIDLSVPDTLTLSAVVTVGVGQGPTSACGSRIGVALAAGRAGRAGQRDPHRGLGLNALIVTLAVGQIVSGFAFRYYSSRHPDPGPRRALRVDIDALPRASPGPSGWGCAITLVLIVLFRFTTPGRRFQVVGANPTAASIAGLRVNLNQVLGLRGGGGPVRDGGDPAGRRSCGTVSITIGAPYLLGPIAAVVIGGASLTGGLASPLSTWVAAFFLAGLNQMMRVMGLPTALQFVVFGARDHRRHVGFGGPDHPGRGARAARAQAAACRRDEPRVNASTATGRVEKGGTYSAGPSDQASPRAPSTQRGGEHATRQAHRHRRRARAGGSGL